MSAVQKHLLFFIFLYDVRASLSSRWHTTTRGVYIYKKKETSLPKNKTVAGGKKPIEMVSAERIHTYKYAIIVKSAHRL